LAADLVGKRVAATVTNNIATAAAKAATSTIPIVFVTGGDPVENGLVTSLNRLGGNVTGVSFSSNPLNPRRLELLHELVPKTAVIGALMTQTSERPLFESLARRRGRSHGKF